MPMSNDLIRSRDQIRASMMQALKSNDPEAFTRAQDELMELVATEVSAKAEASREDMIAASDAAVLAQRGVRQLTSEERKFYALVKESALSSNPQQALTGGSSILPKTTINSVFDELQTRHPLLSRIDFRPSGGAAEIVTSTNGYQKAVWGELCDETVKEVLAGFITVNAMALKLSAFLPVCKALLELGPEWLDDWVRQVLYETLANGLEYGFVTGSGKNEPIGMDRQVGEGVAVVDGVYPKKVAIAVNEINPTTIGNLLSLMAVDASSKPRQVRDVILLCNPADYFSKIMPATTVMAPDGTYRNDVMPYPMTIIQTMALDSNEALIGLGYRYLGVGGTEREGRIEYSDHFQFLAGKRVYLIYLYGTGMPLDNNAFQRLDISGLQPALWKLTGMVGRTPSDDATLASLQIGTLTLSPSFDPDTDTYTASTTGASAAINVLPADAGASVLITHNGTIVPNGGTITWSTASSGSNLVKVLVTAEDGVTQEEYTVTVTKT